MSQHLLLNNIQTLAGITEADVKLKRGSEMDIFNTISNAWLYIHNGMIEDFGSGMPNFSIISDDSNERISYDSSDSRISKLVTTIDCSGKMVFPSFCDSHTHLVYAGSRELEYIDKIKGLSYEEIAKRGGGILNSAKRLHETSEDELFDGAIKRLDEITSYGTGAVEIKSGYGLNTHDEIKMLRVIKRLKAVSNLAIKATFLGAHAVPHEFKGNQSGYVDLIINEMIPMVGEMELADYIDVFCDKGFFTVEETDRILTAGAEYGLQPKIHANELDYSGGIQIGVKHNSLSVDHLEFTGDEEIKMLLNSSTMPTVLPGAAFFLNMIHAPVRKMINAGLPVALASDFNPGSSPSGNMQLILSMGCITFRMLPNEAFNATTINGAYAMGLSDTHGSITKGKVANVYITKPIPTLEFMPYYYGSNKIETTILKGQIIHNI